MMKTVCRTGLLLCLVSISVLAGSCEDETVIAELLHVWSLESFGLLGDVQPILPQTEITLEFDDEYTIRGTACNYYFGSYEAQEDGMIAFKHIAMTEMACLDPDGIMEQESRYLEAVAMVSAYEVNGERLRLFYHDGQGVLNYTMKRADETDNQPSVLTQ